MNSWVLTHQGVHNDILVATKLLHYYVFLTHLIIFADNIWEHHHYCNPRKRVGNLKQNCTHGELNEIEGVAKPSAYRWTSYTEFTSYNWFWNPVTMILTFSLWLTNIHSHKVSSNIQKYTWPLNTSDRFWLSYTSNRSRLFHVMKDWFNYCHIARCICWPLAATGCSPARAQSIWEVICNLRMMVQTKISARVVRDGLPVGHQYQSNYGDEKAKDGDDTAIQVESLHQ